MRLALAPVLCGVLAACAAGGPSASPSPAESVATAMPTASPSPSPTASPTPVPSTTASPTTEPVDGVALSVGDDVATLLAGWGNRLIALGDDHVWTSGDGIAWEVAETSGLDGVVVRLIERGDGTLLAIGYTGEPGIDTFRTWTSPDGRRWQPSDVGLPREFVFHDLARGDRGYVLVGKSFVGDGTAEQLWYSNEALTWELEWTGTTGWEFLAAAGAGPEGFVAVGRDRTVDWQAFVLASADGRQWIAAPDSPVLAGDCCWTIAPFHSDWVTSPNTQGTALPILWSANGLDWEERTSLPIADSDDYASARLMSDGSRLFAALAGKPTLLTSLDAIAWTPTDVPFGEECCHLASTSGLDAFLVDGAVYLYRQ